MQFKDKVVVITGASSGIGEQLAKDFSLHGARVVMLSRNIQKLAILQNELPLSFAIECDVSKESSVKRAFTAIKHMYGNVDILINNAGVGKFGLFEKQRVDEMRAQMDVNYFGTIHCIKEALPLMTSGSRIINVSSLVGKIGIPCMSSYVASKFAVTGLTDVLYYELLPKGIHVHAVYPAGVKTNFFAHQSFDRYLSDLHPESWITAKDVSRAVLRGIQKKQHEIYVPWHLSLLVKLRAVFFSLSRLFERTYYRNWISPKK